MAFLLALFKGKPTQPEHVPTDTIIPLFRKDDTSSFRALTIGYSMRFDHVLDASKLAEALQTLLAMPGWRKFGARLRLNKTGSLEYHVPEQFTANRPSVTFTHANHGISISQHPLGSQVPAQESTFFVTPESHAVFEPLMFPENHPTNMNDWIYTDRPALQLHIVSFTDATLVSLSWLHTLFDAMGRKTLLEAWTAVLEGRTQDVPEFCGYDIDPLESLGDPAPKEVEYIKDEKFVLDGKQISFWGTIRFVIGLLWETFRYPTTEKRQLRIPGPYIARIKREAIDELAKGSTDGLVMNTIIPDHPLPFLSDGDIVGAWWVRQCFSAQPWASTASPNRTILFMNVLGMRSILSKTSPILIPAGKAFMSNCTTVIQSFFTLSEVRSLPLGKLAARIRSDLAIQSTRSQVEASHRIVRKAIEKTGNPPLYSAGHGDIAISAFTNWTQARFYETDFSAAVVSVSDSKAVRVERKGKPSYIHAFSWSSGLPFRNFGGCVGKDAAGNWWVASEMRPDAWVNLEKTIKSLS
ncbi:hypothetical protein B0J11DRAFT_423588 [Dendryphion nanum]|uniref:Uncharacterized protein n=1 Tax=Dendryphion nanum TaxID=256645 RepID=A0A9P9EJR6_9PLEO|nr:hypothetical protein B0J11DRAFT_423588 [Dendryphion nanum]